MKNKLIFLGLLFSLILIVSACSGEQDATEENDNNETASEASDLLVVTGDTVSEQGGCVLASRFTAGDKIVFRTDVVDPETGEQALDAKVQVHLSNGEVLDMAYGQHAEDNFWVVAYPVTEETPTGTLNYHITAEQGDKKGELEPFDVAPSLLTIVDPATVDAPEAEAPEAEAPEEEVDLGAVETNQTIDLIGRFFEFTNAEGEKTFYVKAGEEVTINLTNEEGLHGFDIKDLGVSLADAGTVKFTPEEAGEYEIACNLFCGAGHSDMKSTLVVVK